MEKLNVNLPFTLVLGSNSPRRKAILSECGFEFIVQPSNIQEDFPEDLSPELVPQYLSEKKALSIKDAAPPNSLILAADTVVILEGKILNKPSNYSEAFSMLKSLSGKKHQVITGFCLIFPDGKKILKDDMAVVEFKELSDFEIDFYLQQGGGLDKAGAYGIQDYIGMIGIKKLEGSFYTVMGLPIFKIYEILLPLIR